MTELFINALLPPDRKLLSIPMRGADWKALKKNDNVDKSTKDKVYALWHYEATLKENYFGEHRPSDSRPINLNNNFI